MDLNTLGVFQSVGFMVFLMWELSHLYQQKSFQAAPGLFDMTSVVRDSFPSFLGGRDILGSFVHFLPQKRSQPCVINGKCVFSFQF